MITASSEEMVLCRQKLTEFLVVQDSSESQKQQGAFKIKLLKTRALRSFADALKLLRAGTSEFQKEFMNHPWHAIKKSQKGLHTAPCELKEYILPHVSLKTTKHTHQNKKAGTNQRAHTHALKFEPTNLV